LERLVCPCASGPAASASEASPLSSYSPERVLFDITELLWSGAEPVPAEKAEAADEWVKSDAWFLSRRVRSR